MSGYFVLGFFGFTVDFDVVLVAALAGFFVVALATGFAFFVDLGLVERVAAARGAVEVGAVERPFSFL